MRSKSALQVLAAAAAVSAALFSAPAVPCSTA